MQVRVLFDAPHTTPPCSAWRNVARCRTDTPLPHVCVHDAHAPQSDCTQLTGQACALQCLSSRVCAHLRPPYCACTVGTRDRLCQPEPHDSEHMSHAPQSESAQSTGHECELQTRCCDRAPHATPPCAAGVTVRRARLCTPEPHDREHAPHAPQAETMQSMGQACSLQGCVSASAGQM